jgi:hypothetical protein
MLIEYGNSTKINQRNSPLLRLPAEIRNTIYELALHDVTTKLVLKKGQRNRKLGRSTALVHTCRQTRHEAQPMFNALTKFHMSVTIDYLADEQEEEDCELETVQSVKLDDWCFSFASSFLRAPDDHRSAAAAIKNFANSTKIKYLRMNVLLGHPTETDKFSTDYTVRDEDQLVHIHVVQEIEVSKLWYLSLD